MEVSRKWKPVLPHCEKKKPGGTPPTGEATSGFLVLNTVSQQRTL